MADSFEWLIVAIGMMSLFNGLENVFPNVARTFLKKRMEQPDYYFRAVGVLFLCLGIAIIYVGLRR